MYSQSEMFWMCKKERTNLLIIPIRGTVSVG